MDAAIILRVLLVTTIAVMAVVALVYLLQRDLSPRDKIGWGLLALLVPLLGPFLVILHHPGRFRRPSAGQTAAGIPRLRMFALLGPRRRRLLRPLIPSSVEKRDNSV